jgi:hypothetical protein
MSNVERRQHRPSDTRKGASSSALCDEGLPSTRATSPRQLPTDHDYDGGPRARSANIRVINRREQLPRPVLRLLHEQKHREFQ